MEEKNNFEKQAFEMVYNTDNYTQYFEAYRLEFAGWGNFTDKNSKVDIIGTLEQNGKYELADFYRELFEMVGIDNYNSYEPTLESILKNGIYSIHDFSILNKIFNKNTQCEFRFGFLEYFENCFNWDDNSFQLNRLKENTAYDTAVGNFFQKWADYINGLQFENELKELIEDIVNKIDYAMDCEYTETLYNIENGNTEW